MTSVAHAMSPEAIAVGFDDARAGDEPEPCFEPPVVLADSVRSIVRIAPAAAAPIGWVPVGSCCDMHALFKIASGPGISSISLVEKRIGRQGSSIVNPALRRLPAGTYCAHGSIGEAKWQRFRSPPTP
jgi:hypothetical protein